MQNYPLNCLARSQKSAIADGFGAKGRMLTDDSQDMNTDQEQASDASSNAQSRSRVRFKGIIEAAGSEVLDDTAFPSGFNDERKQNLRANARQVWLVSRLIALFIFIALLLGQPLGDYFAHLKLTGSANGWSFLDAYDQTTLIFAFIVPLLVLLIGYISLRQSIMLNAAEEIAVAAQQMMAPGSAATQNVNAVGDVMRGHMDTFNDGLDNALSRLATVEAMIRQHVEAIEIAGDAIEQKATNAVTRVADERSRLMELTESLNAHADSFAAAIAERAKASIEALERADTVPAQLERDFDERLVTLEHAANRAVGSFETLCAALHESENSAREAAVKIDESAQYTENATKRATAASNAAAESAALNAANVAASADRAAQAAREAAKKAIDQARADAEAAAETAMRTSEEKTADMRAATEKALEQMNMVAKDAADRARADASDAAKAADDVIAAAKAASEAAQRAAEEVAKASHDAKQNAEDALKQTQTTTLQTEERSQALSAARVALEKENERLESLIEEQKNRANRIADAITAQTARLSKLAEAQLREQETASKLAQANRDAEEKAAQARLQKATDEAAEREKAAARATERERAIAQKVQARAAKLDDEATAKTKPRRAPAPQTKSDNGAARIDELADEIAGGNRRNGSNRKVSSTRREKSDVSWREILDAAEDSEPLDLASADKSSKPSRDSAADAMTIISALQDFTYNLESRLYGDPPPALQERYDRGDRNVFANRLLRLNESDVKRRIRGEAARDRRFESDMHQFLQSFESLLEDATTSDHADEELEEYLSSPLGRVYLLIGATVGYFA